MSKERRVQLEKKLWLLKESLESQVIDKEEYDRSKARIEEELKILDEAEAKERFKPQAEPSTEEASAEPSLAPKEIPESEEGSQKPERQSTAAFASASSSFGKEKPTPAPDRASPEEPDLSEGAVPREDQKKGSVTEQRKSSSEGPSAEELLREAESSDEEGPEEPGREGTPKRWSRAAREEASSLSHKYDRDEPEEQSPEEKPEKTSAPSPEPSPAPIPSEPSGERPRWWLWILGVAIIVGILYAASVGLDGDDMPAAQEEDYACMTDADCAQAGMEGICRNPGTGQAECIIQNATKLNLTILAAEGCSACDTTRVQTILRGWFPGVSIEEVSHDSADGQSLRAEHGISVLPAYLLEGPVEQTLKYGQVMQIFERSGETFVMKPGAAGSVYYLSRPATAGRIDVFLSLPESSSVSALRNMQEFMAAFPDADIRYRFVSGSNASRFGACLASRYPLAYPSYASCTASGSEDCAEAAGMAQGVITDCSTGTAGESMIQQAQILQRSLGITAVPSFFINNQMFVSGVQPADSLREHYCSLNDVPGCDEDLSKSLI